jgi:hypothetical protein
MTTSDEVITSKVGYLVKRVQAALRATMDKELRPLGLSVSQYAILEALLDEGASESTNAAIARRCFVTIRPDAARAGEMPRGSPAGAGH